MHESYRRTFKFEYPGRNPTDNTEVNVRVSIRYPQISNHPNPLVERKINTFLKEWAGVNVDHQREPWDHAADFEVVSFEYNTLVLFLADGGLRIGAASGDTVSKTLVLNLLNGEPFELKDVFRAGYQQPLLELAKARAFCDSKRQTSAEPMEVRDDQQFFIKEGALALVYQRREICAGVFGPTVITIEGSALRPLLNPNGPLGYLV